MQSFGVTRALDPDRLQRRRRRRPLSSAITEAEAIEALLGNAL